MSILDDLISQLATAQGTGVRTGVLPASLSSLLPSIDARERSRPLRRCPAVR
jgi:hypothetical protein